MSPFSGDPDFEGLDIALIVFLGLHSIGLTWMILNGFRYVQGICKHDLRTRPSEEYLHTWLQKKMGRRGGPQLNNFWWILLHYFAFIIASLATVFISLDFPSECCI